ncbi:glycosyltransferase [Bacillus methanolicus PB1]|uniref:Glycosyltransferase n=1 Tax=Bacillus methanolicus PB1 TaxID=997296 RepID=I3E4A2_BACMT|nr:glycosyltransferase [Bacillus methanolicus]EIJ81323.1 glycosyltransferase [Bacillus methanolicus PB1]
MNIAFDMSFTQSASDKRGIGEYTRNLIETITKLDNQNSYFYFYPSINQENTSIEGHLNYFLDKNSIDIFHITSPFEFIANSYPQIYRFNEIKVVVTLYDLIPLLYSNIYLTNETKENYMKTLNFIRSCELVFAISETTKNDAITYANIDPQKIVVIMGGISEKFRVKKNFKLNLLNNKYGITKPYILFSGGIEFRKNLRRFLEAFAKLPHLINRYQIVFFNHLNNFEILQINNLAAEYNIKENIVITGFLSIDELIDIYNSAELFAFPSLYEGFGLPVLEAMACGVPVLTSNNSSLKEIAGEAAYTVNPENVEEISTGLEILLTNQQLRKKLKSLGLQNVKKYNWESVGRRVINAFNQLEQITINKKFVTHKDSSINHIYIKEKKIYETVSDLIKLNNKDFLYALYKEILNREPDQYGFERHMYNLSKGISKITLLSKVLLSEEAKLLFSNTYFIQINNHTILSKIATMLSYNNKEFISASYEEFLNRKPSLSELELYNLKLTDENSKILLLVSIINSTEFKELMHR